MSLAAVVSVPPAAQPGAACDASVVVQSAYASATVKAAPGSQPADSLPADTVHHRVFIARHGERADFANPAWKATAANPDDPPLTERGLQQAHELGVRLQDEGIQHIYASPFLRTAQTAHQVAAVLGLAVRLEIGICEGLTQRIFPAGRPHLRSPHELSSLLPLIDTSYRSHAHVAYPETYQQAQARCQLVAQLIAERHPHENVLLVGHGLSVEYLARAYVTNQPCSLHIPYCALTECIRSPGGKEWRYGVHMQHDFLSVQQPKTEADIQRASWGMSAS
ncbi:hypothetical protein WJX72_000173 [[Myrmecia] bisecta]|uniref:Phosphoglycerate mutase n=1 Tax=[Myrmecia] bisecta TaxID=41462 RepID=A0AAW1QDZ2_9CHLO